MIVNRKRIVVIEMDNVDYNMLLDTLGEASKVRSKLFPSLNEKAALLYGSMTAGETWPKSFDTETHMLGDFGEEEKRVAAALAVHIEEHKEMLDAKNE